MTFSVDGTALKCTSETVKKSLDPTWKQVMTLELPKGPAEGLKLLGKCEDVDEVWRRRPRRLPDAIDAISCDGRSRRSPARISWVVKLGLTECLDGKVKLWRTLQPRTEKDGSPERARAQWRYNARLDFARSRHDRRNEGGRRTNCDVIRAQGLVIACVHRVMASGARNLISTQRVTNLL